MGIESWDFEAISEKCDSLLEKIGNQAQESIRWGKIHIGGKVLHLLIRGGFHDFLQKFVERVKIDAVSTPQHQDNVTKLSHGGNIISLNHVAGNFSDYIPLFLSLPPEVLEKTYFFSIHQTSPMFQREFPEIAKRCIAQNGTPQENRKRFLEVLQAVKARNANIFIMPRMEVSEDTKDSLPKDQQDEITLAQRTFQIIRGRLPEDTNWLKCDISFDEQDGLSYGEIYKRALLGTGESIGVQIDSELIPLGKDITE